MEHNWKAGYFIYCTDTLILGAQFTNGFWIEELKEISKNKNLLCPKHTFTKFLPAFHANMGNDFPDIVAAGFLLGFWMHKYLGELTSKQILLCIWGRNSVIPFFLIFFSHQHEDFSSIDGAGSAVLLKSSNCAIHLFRSVEFIITVIRFSELSMQIIPLQSRVKSMQFIPPK